MNLLFFSMVFSLIFFASSSAVAIPYETLPTKGGSGIAGCIGSKNCTLESWGIDLNEGSGYQWQVAGIRKTRLYLKVASLSGKRAMSVWVNGQKVQVIEVDHREAPRPHGTEVGIDVDLKKELNIIELRDSEGFPELDVLFLADETAYKSEVLYSSMTTTLSGKVINTGYDRQLRRDVLRDLIDVNVCFDGSYNDVVGVRRISQCVRSGADGTFNFGGWVPIQKKFISAAITIFYDQSNIEVVDANDKQAISRFNLNVGMLNKKMEIRDNSPGAWHLATIRQAYAFASARNMIGGSFSKVVVSLSPGFSAGDDGRINLGNAVAPMGPSIHEFGHFLLFSNGVEAFGRIDRYESNLKSTVIQRDDSRVDSSEHNYHAVNSLRKHEEFADFFGGAYLDFMFGADYRNNSLYLHRFESNIGGRDVFLQSDTLNLSRHHQYNVFGKNGGQFIYPNTPISAYSGVESTLLWDLYDGNEYLGFIWDTPSSTFATSNAGGQLINDVCFSNSEYIAAAQKGYFSQSGLRKREVNYDTVKLPLEKLFSAIVADNKKPYRNIAGSLSEGLSALEISREQLADINRLHSNYYMLESKKFSGKFLRHRNAIAYGEVINSDQSQYDAEWKLMPSLKDTGDSELISIESVNYPGSFLRHKDFSVLQHADDGSLLFAQDASWKVEVVKVGADAYYRFYSSNFSDYVLYMNESSEIKIGHKNQIDLDASLWKRKIKIPFVEDTAVTTITKCL